VTACDAGTTDDSYGVKSHLVHRGGHRQSDAFETYQAKNSSRPRLYTKRVIGEETLSSASAFRRLDCSGWGTAI
jgi:hypothetical protein